MAGRAGQPLVRVSAFWDTSAIIPLCVRQSTTARAVEIYKTNDVSVWWAAPVEMASALARLVRMQQISASDYANARKLAKILSHTWFVVQPSEAVRAKAERLVDRYDLRAGDSFQLAAALEWCEDAPQGRTFVSEDERLREAALLSGFDARKI